MSRPNTPPKPWANQGPKSFKPKGIALSSDSLVTEGSSPSGGPLPATMQPITGKIDLASWVGDHFEMVQRRLHETGGVLFRGFDLKDRDDFDRVLHAMPVELTSYVEGATPRTRLGGKVYTSTEFPPSETIALHNELSYVTSWPMKIFFFCQTPAAEGGETPLADVRRVYERIDPEIRERFAEQGWMLVRNFGWGFGPTWQNAYLTADREALEAYFDRAEIEFEWEDDEHLRTTQVRPAATDHPVTGEPVWFNHVAFWHASSLAPHVREALIADLGEERLPYNTYYGDGSPIDDETVAVLRAAYDAETVAFPWQRGDLLMLDNMKVAHGRRPFTGARRVLAAMGDVWSRKHGKVVSKESA